jgi:hypothetical protein
VPKSVCDGHKGQVAFEFPHYHLWDYSTFSSEPKKTRRKVTSPEGASGGVLRILTETGHGAVKFGIPVSAEAFLKEIQIALLNPPQCITWIESKPWNFFMRDTEAGQTYGSV